MRDLTGVFWTRFDGKPRKLGSFVMTEREFRTSCEPSALDLPPIAAALLPESFMDRPHIHYCNEALPYPAFVWAKIPQPNPPERPRNLQRLIYARAVAAASRSPPGLETEYEILMLAGRDGIGHVDAFKSDEAAKRFYADHQKRLRNPMIVAAGEDLWDIIRKVVGDAIEDEAAFQAVSAVVGQTPSIQGMIPKLAASIPDKERWDGRTSLPGVASIADDNFVDAIVKMEPDLYPGLLALEEIAYDVHASLGIRTPRRWGYRTNGGARLLAVERFDRKNGKPIPMESMFSVLSLLGGARTNVLTPIDGAYESVAKALRLATPAVSLRSGDREDFFKRVVLSLLTGNGDMHLENLAVLGAGEEKGLSPVFDPAPMRAYAQHQQVSAVRWFQNDPAMSGAIPVDLVDRVKQLGAACAMTARAIEVAAREALEATEDYLRTCREHPETSEQVGERLTTAVEGLRYRLSKEWSPRTPGFS